MAGKVRILKERLFKVKKDDTKLLYVEGACDNDATPPQGNFVTGSAFENVTSGNKYKYSETSGDWVLQPNEGGGGSAVINVMDVPYVAQALQSNVTTFVTNALTNTPNEPDYHLYTTVNENTTADMEYIVAFLTENEGKSIYLVADSVYQPVNYKASNGYVSIKMKGVGETYAYDLDIEIMAVGQGSVISGVAIAIYGWVTTNV